MVNVLNNRYEIDFRYISIKKQSKDSVYDENGSIQKIQGFV